MKVRSIPSHESSFTLSKRARGATNLTPPSAGALGGAQRNVRLLLLEARDARPPQASDAR
jgi:hypothetical protein